MTESSTPHPVGDAEVDEALARVEAVPADDVAGRLAEGERLHQVLSDRLTRTGRDGG